MNKAQKWAWILFAISLATLVISAIGILYVRQNQINFSDTNNNTLHRMQGLIMTIPLILIVVIVVLEKYFFKKCFDERDTKINRIASSIGAIGTLAFLAAAGLSLTVITKMGSIKATTLLLLVYLAAFVWFLIMSATTLFQYGWRKNNVEN